MESLTACICSQSRGMAHIACLFRRRYGRVLWYSSLVAKNADYCVSWNAIRRASCLLTGWLAGLIQQDLFFYYPPFFLKVDSLFSKQNLNILP